MSTSNPVATPVPASAAAAAPGRPFLDYFCDAKKQTILVRAKNTDGSFVIGAPVITLNYSKATGWIETDEETGETIDHIASNVKLYAQRNAANVLRAADLKASTATVAQMLAPFVDFQSILDAGRLTPVRVAVAPVKKFDEAVIFVALANANKALKAKGQKPATEAQVVAALMAKTAEEMKAYKEKYAEAIDAKREEIRTKVREATEAGVITLD